MIYEEKLSQSAKKAGCRVDPETETINLWKNYLSQTNLKRLNKVIRGKNIKTELFVKIRSNNRYFFALPNSRNHKIF